MDASPTMIRKNLLPIAQQIHLIDPEARMVFISIDISSHVNSEKDESAKRELVDYPQSEYIVMKSFSTAKISAYLSGCKADAMFIGAYRVFDMLWTYIAKQFNIKVYKFQHGYEIDSVYYKPHIFWKHIRKSARMFIALINLSRLLEIPIYKSIRNYSEYFFKGKRLAESAFNSEMIHPDDVFIYSEYYRNFWHRKFGFDPRNMHIIGPPDLIQVQKIKNGPRQDAICYLSQTLVEDGRMAHSQFEKIMDEYLEVAKTSKKFIIKTHPRGNKKLYKKFAKMSNVEITQVFPYCDTYITHYSSTAFVAYYLSPRVILHEVAGHPTPEVFREFGFHIVRDFTELMDALRTENLFDSEQYKMAEYYAPMPVEQPEMKVARYIMEHL